MFDIPRLLTTGLPELLHHHLGLRVDDAQATTRAIATEYAIRPRMDLRWQFAELDAPRRFKEFECPSAVVSMRTAEVRFARLRSSDVPGREVCGPVRLVGFDGAEVWTWTPKLPRYDWPHVATMLGGFGLLADGRRADFLDLAPWWSIVLPGKAAVALYALAEAHTLVVARDPKTGACGSVVNLLDHATLNHQTTAVSGVLAEECGQYLRDFFRDRRGKTKQVDSIEAK